MLGQMRPITSKCTNENDKNILTELESNEFQLRKAVELSNGKHTKPNTRKKEQNLTANRIGSLYAKLLSLFSMLSDDSICVIRHYMDIMSRSTTGSFEIMVKFNSEFPN